MYRVLVVTDSDVEQGHSPVAQEKEILCSYASYKELGRVGDGAFDTDVVLLDMGSLNDTKARDMTMRCREVKLPVMAIIPWEGLEDYIPEIAPDDFVLRPFRTGELLTRIKVLVDRVRGRQGSRVIKAGDVEIDADAYEVIVSRQRVFLTYKEYQKLVLLASNPGRVYSREEILTQIWGYDYFGGTRTVDVHIRRLRSKLEPGNRTFIETVWNVGYRLRVQG